MIADGYRLNVSVGEVALTDFNLLRLRRKHPALHVYKFSGREEVETGADWEWWIRTGTSSWTSMVFQAKKLSRDRRYDGLMKTDRRGQYQLIALINRCVRRSGILGGTVWPMYCFYNGWDGGWPGHVALPSRPVDTHSLPLFGCAVIGAFTVGLIAASKTWRRTSRDTYLPYMLPWSNLFGDPADTAPMPLFRQIVQGQRNADRMFHGDARRAVMRRGELALTSRFPGVHRFTLEPATIDTPPDYVLDIVEERPPRRGGMGPIGRMVAVVDAG